MRRTKIVCTLGPASASREILEEMILKGMNVARLNFSHGTHESHGQMITLIRDLSEKLGKPLAVMQDLCGPKIRLGEIAGAPVTVSSGDPFLLTEDEIVGDATKAHVSYKNLSREVHAGDRILIDDGLVEMRVEGTKQGEVACRVVVGGLLNPRKGVNFPGVKLSVPSLTEKDFDDLKFGIRSGVDLVAISFVRAARDLTPAYQVMEREGTFLPIISKIEKQEAVDDIEAILQRSYGIMVARGDMGVELPFQEVPFIQKKLIRMCRERAKPVITATQMLDSMIRNPMPTRAEVTDVANAILDGTDAVMLSGESASGKYPREAVETLARIADYTEKFLPYEHIFQEPGIKLNAVEAVSLATCEMAEQMDAKAIIVATSSGRTARAIAKYRPRAPVIAATDERETSRRLVLSWGVFPVVIASSLGTEILIEDMCNAALATGLVKGGDLSVLTAGIPEGMKGSTNTIKLHILGHHFVRGTGVGALKTATGRICVTRSVEEIGARLQRGDILLVRRLEDAMEPLVMAAGGIISQEGDSHSPLNAVLEKAGIPGIVGVPGALDLFEEGKIVTIDAQRGLILTEPRQSPQ
ncbi:MAG: pyruvate kinase [Candidatus Eremiobacteraeota bacterium]|nr:pyruvate kinase [Candidatus Eremiobacteraeota bacterium]